LSELNPRLGDRAPAARISDRQARRL
jgi:hypothetical protein